MAVGTMAGLAIGFVFNRQLFDDRFIGFPTDEFVSLLDSGHRMMYIWAIAGLLVGPGSAGTAGKRRSRHKSQTD